MAAPITWQNVNTPNPAAAAPLLGQAQTSINGAFDSFNRILAQREAFNSAQQAQGQEAVKQNFLDLLDSAKTPEAVAKLQQSGAIDAARANMSAANLAATRGADEARTAATRTNETAANTFTDQLRNRAELPIIGAIKTQALTDPKAAQAALDASSLYDKASTQQFLHETAQKLQAESHAEALFPLTLDNAKIANTEGQIRLTAAEQTAKDTEIARAAQESLGNFAADHKTKMESARAGVESVTAGIPNLPRGFDGTLDLGALSSDQSTALNTRLKAKGLPLVESLIGADTRAAKEYDDTLAKMGVKPEVRLKMQPQIANALSSAPTAPIGADAAYLDRKNRADAALDQTNAMTYGSVATPDSAKALTDTATQLVKTYTKPGSWREEAFNQGFSRLISSDGIMVDGVRVLPSPAQLQQITMGAKNSYFGGNGAELQKAWDAWKTNPDNIAGAKEAIRMNQRKIRQGINPSLPSDQIPQPQ